MKITYNAPKGKRHKKGTIKVKGLGMRKPVFQCVACLGYWWNEELKVWSEECNHGDSTHYFGVKNIKQFVRHMKKHGKYLPKGTQFILVSSFMKINDVFGVL